VLRRPLRSAHAPRVATLDDALWERVGRLLVARSRLTKRELEAAFAEQRRTRVPLDEILVDRGYVSRHEVASTVLIVQLGRGWREKLRERPASGAPLPSASTRPELPPLPDVPAGPRRVFALVCLAIDVSMLTLAALAAALARRSSDVPLPPAAWMAAFAALAVGLYWSWRLYMFRTKLRPVADSLLIAGATSLAAMTVLTIRSLAGESGVGDELLPLWAFAAVYGVAGRMGFYLAWSAKLAMPPQPAAVEAEVADEPALSEAPSPPPISLRARRMEVVALRPELWGVFDELRREVDALVREQREAELGELGGDLAETG
jgi:hypothetical protein